MKKLFIFLMLICIFLVTGCGKSNAESVFKDFTNKISKLDTYTISGVLDVKNNNNTYNYDVEVSFKSKDKYKVTLINQANNHEQVILRNDDGVFVLTPSLNKSFKFQSDWPYNNSQIYILGMIVEDLNKDPDVLKEEKDDKYVFTSKVNYPNNNKLTKQRVTVNSDLFVESVEVLNEEGNEEMKFTIKNTDYNPTFDETYFEVNSIINTTNNSEKTKDNDNENNANNKETTENKKTDTNCNPEDDSNCKENQNNNVKQESNAQNNLIATRLTMTMNGDEDITDTVMSSSDSKTTPTATLDDVIYPLYLPTGTVLKNQEKVSKTDGERVILTFAGEKEFTLVEETALKEKEFTIIPTYGEPGFVNDTIGAITDNSLNWISNGIEYYMVSDVMNTVELLDVANSINVKAVANLK